MQGPFPTETTNEWESIGDAAIRMRLRNRGDPSRFSWLVASFMGTAVWRANRKDLAKVEEILESPDR